MNHGQSLLKTPLQTIQYLDKYARWRTAEGRRERWEETVDRTSTWLADRVGSVGPWPEVRAAMLAGDVMPSMRIVQMAGPALDRCHVGAYNCAYLPLDSIDSFAELLYILMQGTGCGFSVENQYVRQLPLVKEPDPSLVVHYRIPDDTPGWCDALRVGLSTWFKGGRMVYDYTAIRPSGALLRTKGGRASGPDPLRELFEFCDRVIGARRGNRLRPIDAHGIACYVGWIVQVGGVRRAATISLSDLDDEEMVSAKSGEWWLRHPWRAMANNSAVWTESHLDSSGLPRAEMWDREWAALVGSGSGERGFFNRALRIPEHRVRDEFGINPCGEIVLRPRQFCNLSIAVARPTDSRASLAAKVRLASYLGTVQSTLTDFGYLPDRWRTNCMEERLLGVDITGQQDCPLLRAGASGQASLLARLREIAIDENRRWAYKLGINPSASVTCVKPSGNSGVLLDASSGIHPRYAPYYIRRLRLGAGGPIHRLLMAHGVEGVPEVGHDPAEPRVVVIEMPVKAPAGAVTRKDLTAIQQLQNWLIVKKEWTEHNPSCTIYVQPHEWPALSALVRQHFASVGGLTFLPADDHTYRLAPMEEISAARYAAMAAAMPTIDFTRLREFEHDAGAVTSSREWACTAAGGCEI